MLTPLEVLLVLCIVDDVVGVVLEDDLIRVDVLVLVTVVLDVW